MPSTIRERHANSKLKEVVITPDVSTHETEVNKTLENESILDKLWSPVCIYSWFIFTAMQLGVGYNRMYNASPLCFHTAKHYGIAYFNTYYICVGGFILTLSSLVMKLWRLKGGQRVPILVSINIVSMAMIATTLTLVVEWGGVCIDGLGVASPAAIWGEYCKDCIYV